MNEDSLRLRNEIYKLAETNVTVHNHLAEWRNAGVRGSWDDTLARIVIALAAANAAQHELLVQRHQRRENPYEW